MHFYEINIYQVMICRLYTVYNKHKVTKIATLDRHRKPASIIVSARIILLPTVHHNRRFHYRKLGQNEGGYLKGF